jgi:hypothetical protein
VRDSNELLLENQVVTGSGTVNTKAVAPKGAKRVAFFLNISAEDSASATTDIDIQISPDQGTTWVDMPQSANSETKASLAQYTTAKSAIKWFEVTGDGLHTRVRANIVTAGHTATDTLTYGPAYWIFSDVD